jgi:hypothetical protein
MVAGDRSIAKSNIGTDRETIVSLGLFMTGRAA